MKGERIQSKELIKEIKSLKNKFKSISLNMLSDVSSSNRGILSIGGEIISENLSIRSNIVDLKSKSFLDICQNVRICSDNFIIKGNIKSHYLNSTSRKFTFKGKIDSTGLDIFADSTSIDVFKGTIPKIISNNLQLKLGKMDIKALNLSAVGNMDLRWVGNISNSFEKFLETENKTKVLIEEPMIRDNNLTDLIKIEDMYLVEDERVLLIADKVVINSECDCYLPFVLKAKDIFVKANRIALSTYSSIINFKVDKLNLEAAKEIQIENLYLEYNNLNLIKCEDLYLSKNFTSVSNLDIVCNDLVIKNGAKVLLKNWNINILGKIDLLGEILLNGDLSNLNLLNHNFRNFFKLTYVNSENDIELVKTLRLENRLKIDNILEGGEINLLNVNIDYLGEEQELKDEDFPKIMTKAKKIRFNSKKINLSNWSEFLRYSDLNIVTSHLNVEKDILNQEVKCLHERNISLYVNNSKELYLNCSLKGLLKIIFNNNTDESIEIRGLAGGKVLALRGIEIDSRKNEIKSYVNLDTISTEDLEYTAGDIVINKNFENKGKILCKELSILLKSGILENRNSIITQGGNINAYNVFNYAGIIISYESLKADRIINESKIVVNKNIECWELYNDSNSSITVGENLVARDEVHNSGGNMSIKGDLFAKYLTNKYSSKVLTKIDMHIEIRKSKRCPIFDNSNYKMDQMVSNGEVTLFDLCETEISGDKILEDILDKQTYRNRYIHSFYFYNHGYGKGKIDFRLPTNVTIKKITCNRRNWGFLWWCYETKLDFVLEKTEFVGSRPIITISGKNHCYNRYDEGIILTNSYTANLENGKNARSPDPLISYKIDKTFNNTVLEKDYRSNLIKLSSLTFNITHLNKDILLFGVGFEDQKILKDIKIPMCLVLGDYAGEALRYSPAVEAIYLEDMLRRSGQYLLFYDATNKVHDYLLALYEPFMWIVNSTSSSKVPTQIKEIISSGSYNRALKYAYHYKKVNEVDKVNYKLDFDKVVEARKSLIESSTINNNSNGELSKIIKLTDKESTDFKNKHNVGIFYELGEENGKKYLFPKLITSDHFEMRRKIRSGLNIYDTVIVLLGGMLQDNAIYMNKIKIELIENGFYVIDGIECINVPDGKHYSLFYTIEEQADKFREILKNIVRKEDKLILIGHSQGGLRGYKMFLREESEKTINPGKYLNIKGLITIATPWNGATLLNNTEVLLKDLINSILLKNYINTNYGDLETEIKNIINGVGCLDLNPKSDFIKKIKNSFLDFKSEGAKELSIYNIIASGESFIDLASNQKICKVFTLKGIHTFLKIAGFIPDILSTLEYMVTKNSYENSNLYKLFPEVRLQDCSNKDIKQELFSRNIYKEDTDLILNIKDQDIFSRNLNSIGNNELTNSIGKLTIKTRVINGIHDTNPKLAYYLDLDERLIYNQFSTIKNVVKACKEISSKNLF